MDFAIFVGSGPSWDRTNDPQIRNLVLYPAELWALEMALSIPIEIQVESKIVYANK